MLYAFVAFTSFLFSPLSSSLPYPLLSPHPSTLYPSSSCLLSLPLLHFSIITSHLSYFPYIHYFHLPFEVVLHVFSPSPLLFFLVRFYLILFLITNLNSPFHSSPFHSSVFVYLFLPPLTLPIPPPLLHPFFFSPLF